jgi:hypothetical protein
MSLVESDNSSRARRTRAVAPRVPEQRHRIGVEPVRGADYCEKGWRSQSPFEKRRIRAIKVACRRKLFLADSTCNARGSEVLPERPGGLPSAGSHGCGSFASHASWILVSRRARSAPALATAGPVVRIGSSGLACSRAANPTTTPCWRVGECRGLSPVTATAPISLRRHVISATGSASRSHVGRLSMRTVSVPARAGG